jgi:hypothetical protein
VNSLRAKTFEKEEFDEESLLRFFHLAKDREVDVMSIKIFSRFRVAVQQKLSKLEMIRH